MNDSERFRKAIAKMDAANREDPTCEVWDGQEVPKEWAYAQRMTNWLTRLAPDAPEGVWLAVRAQHICRWKIPRRDYPQGRRGYLDWRNACKAMHAQLAGEILREVGYHETEITHVSDIIQKKSLKKDPDAQLLEDVACLVFLENYFAEFSLKHDQAKIIGIVRKTWMKMSAQGRAAARTIPLSETHRELVAKAISKT